jgi:hypothetical protein
MRLISQTVPKRLQRLGLNITTKRQKNNEKLVSLTPIITRTQMAMGAVTFVYNKNMRKNEEEGARKSSSRHSQHWQV